MKTISPIDLCRANYKAWLLEKLEWKRRGYSELMSLLFDMEFEYYILKDRSRYYDGTYLRHEFIKEEDTLEAHELYDEDRNTPCSVLEMLAGLSIRVDDEWIGDPGDPKPGAFFEEMLSNLGLLEYNHKNFDAEKVVKKVTKWLRREFNRNGKGSILPINHPRRDQRNIEIWDQLMEYLSEKYFHRH